MQVKIKKPQKIKTGTFCSEAYAKANPNKVVYKTIVKQVKRK